MKLFAALLCLTVASSSLAVEHRVEVLKEAPPSDGVSEVVLKQISTSGYRVIRGTSRTVCDFWPCKEWPAKDGFTPTAVLLYPFQRGQLIGLLRFSRRGSDFRDQRISRGIYTLRFGLQPIDGNHAGTSPTRDFVMLVKAEDDQSPKTMDFEKLMELSTEAGGSTHPAMMCLQRVADKEAKTPSIRHDEVNDWWIVTFAGKIAAGKKKSDLSVALIVAGHANE